MCRTGAAHCAQCSADTAARVQMDSGIWFSSPVLHNPTSVTLVKLLWQLLKVCRCPQTCSALQEEHRARGGWKRAVLGVHREG